MAGVDSLVVVVVVVVEEETMHVDMGVVVDPVTVPCVVQLFMRRQRARCDDGFAYIYFVP